MAGLSVCNYFLSAAEDFNEAKLFPGAPPRRPSGMDIKNFCLPHALLC
jgi:hypothetical protein